MFAKRKEAKLIPNAVQMVNRGWLRYYWTGAVIQHSLQALFLFLAVRWTFHRYRVPSALHQRPSNVRTQPMALGPIGLLHPTRPHAPHEDAFVLLA